MADNPTCETCRWWKDNREADTHRGPVGACHRHAPRYRVSDYPQGSFAPVGPDDFCGEHEARVEDRTCRMHPDRVVKDYSSLYGYVLCSDCWGEYMQAEWDDARGANHGARSDFRKRLYDGPKESPDASR